MNVTSQIKQPIFKEMELLKKVLWVDDFTSGFAE
jgi:hypothetical protein